MPFYDMKCTNEKCKKKDVDVEIMCSMSNSKEQKCKECGELLKITHKPKNNGVRGFRIKGECWTTTSHGGSHTIHD